MTGILELEALGSGTKYRAMAIHADVASREKHEAMGFHNGWATALDQLIEHVNAHMRA